MTVTTMLLILSSGGKSGIYQLDTTFQAKDKDKKIVDKS